MQSIGSTGDRRLDIALDLETRLNLSREDQKLGSFFPIVRSLPKSGPTPLVYFSGPLVLVSATFAS